MNPTTQNNKMTAEEQEAKVRALLVSAYSDAKPSPALRERVAQHAQHYTATKNAAPTYRLSSLAPRRVSLSAVAVVGVALLATTAALYPRWVAAKTLQKVQAAIADVKNAHITYYEIGLDGRRIRKLEMWQAGSNVRTEETILNSAGNEQSVRTEIFAEGKSYRFDPKQNKVTLRRQKQYAHFQSSGFTIASLRSDYARWGWKDTIRDLGMTMWDGRVARQVSIEREEAVGATRLLMYVDPANDLPFHREMQLKEPGSDQWVTRGLGESEYNAALPPHFFAPEFPGAVVFDEDIARDEFKVRLAKGIAEETTSDGRRIVIRDLQANRDGTIFLLYTAGKRAGDNFLGGDRFPGRDWKMALTDNQGNEYIPYDQQLIAYGEPDEDAARGLYYDGERLEADVWVPKKPLETPPSSRQVTLTIHANPINLHGDDWVKVNYTETTTFTLPIMQVSAALTPDFAPFVSLDLDDTAVAKLQTDARGELPPGVHPSPELIGEFIGANSVQGMTFSPDGRTLAAGASPDGVHLWDVATQRVVRSLPLRVAASDLAISPNGSQIALLGSIYDEKKRRYTHAELHLFDLTANRRLWSVSMEIKNQNLGMPAFSPDGQTIATTGFRADKLEKGPDGEEYIAHMMGRLKRWDAKTGADKGDITVPEGNFHPALTTAQDKFVTLQKIVEKKMFHGRLISDVTQTRVKVWNANTGALVYSLPGGEGVNLELVKTSPDGSLIAAGGSERKNGYTDGGVVLVWNANTGALVQTLHGKGFLMNDLVFSPDSASLFAAGGQDYKSIEWWNVRTGKQGVTLVGHGADVLKLAFAPDGSRFASGDLAGRILLWRTPATP